MDWAALELELEAQGVREFGLKFSLIAGADSGRKWSLSWGWVKGEGGRWKPMKYPRVGLEIGLEKT